MSLICSRYAGALIEAAEENGISEEIFDNFREVIKIINENTGFVPLLLNPQVEVSNKKEVLRSVFKGSIPDILLNFLFLLVDKGRTRFINGIFEEFVRLYNERKNILNMEIITAVPLDEVQVNRIEQKYIAMYNKSSARVFVSIDKSLIGGIRVKVGDKVIDNSIKARLHNIKEIMLK